MKNNNSFISGPQGVSGKKVKIGKMYSSGGPQTITGRENVEVNSMDNRLNIKNRPLPFSQVKNFTFFDKLFNLEILSLKNILIALLMGFFGFVAWFIYGVITDEPPNFFPLDEAQAEYRITKNCPNGQGWVEQIQSQGNAYCLEYRGNNVLWKEDHSNSNFFSITIGKSNVNLETYIGKKVKNVKGKYTSSGKQCIQNKCVDISGPYVVVNIDSMELAN